jgi:hypothetical protein
MAATPVDTVKRKEIKGWMKDPYRRAPNKAQYWPQPNRKPRQNLDELRHWLLAMSHELDSELEDEEGRVKQGRTYFELNEAALRDPYKDIAAQRGGSEETRTFSVANTGWDVDQSDTLSKYEQHGLNHVQRSGCYQSLEGVAQSIAATDPEYKELLGSEGPYSEATRYEALAKRGDAYRKHKETQDKRLRWQGMEEYDAVEKANEKLREGLDRTPANSNAKPLPCIGRLHELFELRDGVLVRLTGGRGFSAGGSVTSKHVRVDGEKHATARVAYALATGEDPSDRLVRDGNASHYRKAEGNVIPRITADEDVFRWEAQVNLGRTTITVGQYRSEHQAEEACRLYLKSLDMGLR